MLPSKDMETGVWHAWLFSSTLQRPEYMVT